MLVRESAPQLEFFANVVLAQNRLTNFGIQLGVVVPSSKNVTQQHKENDVTLDVPENIR